MRIKDNTRKYRVGSPTETLILTSDSDVVFELRLISSDSHGAFVLAGVLGLGDPNLQGAAALVHRHSGAVPVLGVHHYRADGDCGGHAVHLAPDDLDTFRKFVHNAGQSDGHSIVNVQLDGVTHNLGDVTGELVILHFIDRQIIIVVILSVVVVIVILVSWRAWKESQCENGDRSNVLQVGELTEKTLAYWEVKCYSRHVYSGLSVFILRFPDG